ncbi:cache domain-containing sensor histidine kinase [Cohnella abietis]|uniref:HAMP domain-containing protein n=1 Tax=Cohnella abietis TaxID=2507935 RepID=A0A3T1DEH7_9BACL|nr:histidine kinase [Cohnella abietis]BBI36493.1 hypothetical protein KCTCHS21_58920 [Cohnella abietis]
MNLRSFYYKYFKTRYFNKLFLVYMCITASVFLLLCNFVIRNVNEMLIDKEIKFSDIVLLNMNDYINSQVKMIKVILQQTYLDTYAREDVFYFLENEMDSLTYLEKKPVFDNYFFSQFSRSEDIVNLYVHKNLDNQIYQYSKAVTSENFPYEHYKYPEMLIPKDSKGSNVIIHPAYSPYYYNSEQGGLAYALSIPIKRRGSSENIGTLIADLDPRGFGNILSRLDKEMSGNIIVLLNKDEVIYDSSGQYFKQQYPYSSLLDSKSASINGHDSIINKIASTIPGITIAYVIPKSSVLQKTEGIRTTIYFLTFLSILVCMILMLIGSNTFSRKVRIVVDAMKLNRNGNLDRRIPVKEARDEIDQIALSFNKMSDELTNYIEQVYLSEIERKDSQLQQKNLELKQKSVEFAALQARINPHFLYNTLEVIRMRALSAKEQSIADMIYILSDLFRSSMSSKYSASLEEELSHAEAYMNLFRIRYNDRIEYEVDIPDELLLNGMIKHILQPLLENYTIHGYKQGSSDNRLRITGYIENANVILQIEDNGKGIPPDKLEVLKARLETAYSSGDGSIGLTNVNGRLKIAFGEQYGLKLTSQVGQGTCVTIRFPQMTQKELKDYVESINRR